jgi:hypothetical protein
MAKVSKAQVGKCVGAGCGKPARFEKKAARAAMKAVRSPRMKDGGKSFPDLNKDGKITKADILKGRGVIKNGGKMKAKAGASVKKKAMGGAKMMKGGGKCKYGC